MLYRVPTRGRLLLHKQRQDRLPVRCRRSPPGTKTATSAHWRGRRPGQPFFAVFNFTNTHESQIREPSAQTKSLVAKLDDAERHDPAKAILPPYYPDTPAVRRDWANYHDNSRQCSSLSRACSHNSTRMGSAEETIVWIWGDHGRGLPRGKRWVYDSGIHAPLVDPRAGKVARASRRRPSRASFDLGA